MGKYDDVVIFPWKKHVFPMGTRVTTPGVPAEKRWAPGAAQRLPSGYVKIAIENGHRNSGFSH